MNDGSVMARSVLLEAGGHVGTPAVAERNRPQDGPSDL